MFDLAARAHRAGKPIVVLKAGLTEKGGEVSRGHTGALAGSGAIYRQAFEQAGIILAEDFDDLAQTVELLMKVKPDLASLRIGMLGTSGGELGNVTDLCEMIGIELPDLSEETLAALQDWLVLPADVLPRNPVDAGTGFNFSGTYEDRMRGRHSCRRCGSLDRYGSGRAGLSTAKGRTANCRSTARSWARRQRNPTRLTFQSPF